MPEDSGQRYRVLLIDDQFSFCQTTRIALQRRYHDLDIIVITQDRNPGEAAFRSAGEKAIEFLERVWSGLESPVHCIFTDQNMPGMIGIQVLKEIKRRDPYSPVVMLTGDAESMQKGPGTSFEHGARGYLFKNSSTFYEELHTTVHRVHSDVTREKWLDILADVSEIEISHRTIKAEYAAKVLKSIKLRFPRGVSFIREYLEDDGTLDLLACENVSDEVIKEIQRIHPSEFPFIEDALSRPGSVFDNEAYRWSDKQLGRGAGLAIPFDRVFHLPLRSTRGLIGSISIYLRKEDGFFLQEEQRYADTLAKLVSAAFFQSNYQHDLFAQANKVTTVIRQFSRCKTEKDVYEVLTDHIHTELQDGPTQGKTTVKRIRTGTPEMELVANRGVERAERIFKVSPAGNGISGWVAYHRKPRLVNDADEEVFEWVKTNNKMKSSVTVPLLNQDRRALAVLNSEHSEIDYFDEEQLCYAYNLSQVAAVYVTLLQSQSFFDSILTIIADRDASRNELLRRVNAVLQEFVGCDSLIIALTQHDNKVALVDSLGIDSSEQEAIRQALAGKADSARPLILQALQDSTRNRYMWNKNDADQEFVPWFPSDKLRDRTMSQYVYLLMLSTGQAIGALTLDFQVEYAIDSRQDECIQQVLPVIARLVFGDDSSPALKGEAEMLRTELAFVSALRNVAHSLNQTSMQIGSHIIEIQKNATLPDDVKHRLRKIFIHAAEIAMLEGNIRCLSRPPRVQPIQFNEVWDMVVSLLEQKLEAQRVTIQNETPDDVTVRCDPVYLQTILSNVLDNSLDAMKGSIDPGIVVLYKLESDFHQFTIEDSGSGFSGITREQAMEYFKTTKSRGSGTGLPFSHDLLKRCGGNLSIKDPRVLSGAAVEITIPAMSQEKEAE